MNAYFLIIAFISFLLIWSSINKQKETLFFIISMSVLFLFAAIRGSGDVDYFNYLEYSKSFTNIKDVLCEKSFIEVGFRLISYFVNLFNLNSQWVIIIMNFISIFSTSYVFNKISINKMLSVFIFLPFFFQLDMHSARTAVAASVGLISLLLLSEKKWFYWIVSIIFAYSFHKVALVLIFPALLESKKIDLSKVYVSILIVVFWGIKNFLSFTKVLVNLLLFVGLDRFANKIISYSQSQFGKPFSLIDPRLLLAAALFIVFSLLIRNSKDENTYLSQNIREIKVLHTYSFLSIFFYIAFSDLTILAVRVTHLFNMASCLIVPILFTEFKFDNRIINLSNNKYILHIVKVVLFFVYLTYIIIVLPKVPYKLFI